jgi:ABC-2 type transport system permease protein
MPELIAAPLRVLRYSTANAWADMWVMYTPLSWCIGWLGRVVLQVIFFAMIGLLLDSPAAVQFLFIGNAVMTAAMEALTSIASSTWERAQGTLPLLIAAPTRLWPVFAGRSVQWLPSGVLTASVALFAVGPAFGTTWTPGRALAALGCLVVVAVATYCFALAVAALALAMMNLRNTISSLVQVGMMVICGVMVPVTFWPGWVQGLAQTLPLTHGLVAIRVLADPPAGGVPAADTLPRILLAAGIGAAWLLLAALLLERLAAAGRRTGSIEFAD